MVLRTASLPAEPPRTLQHEPDLPTDRYLLDQPVRWNRVGVAVGVVLVGALVVLAVFPDATVAAVDAVFDRFPAITH